MKRSILALGLGAALLIPAIASAQDQLRAERLAETALPASFQHLKLSTPLHQDGVDIASFQRAPLVGDSGRVLIRLVSPSVAEQKVRGQSAQHAKRELQAEQTDLLAELRALDPNTRVIAQTQLVLNAVFVEASASALYQLAQNPDVRRIVPIADYQMDLSETVPYISASSVQGMGFDGAGIRVAVLDSGIDYYHAALGGSGNPADYAADDPDVIEPGTFPTAKVVGGFDYVGSAWPSAALAPDPDPLDDGSMAGHGTHVADIIGGTIGVAPAVDLYAVKVCSSISTSCSGVAMVQGMEFAVDPDGDGDPSDHVDVVNMSIGSPYGQPFDDDISHAVDNATSIGVMTVASAGNSADKPYATGTPSAAPTALSVAQTHVPSAGLQLLDVDGALYEAVFQSWSAPLTMTLSGPVQYGDGAGGATEGCSTGGDVNSTAAGTEPFPPGSLTGLIVLVDRGTCNFSIKIFNVQRGGGLAGIIGLVAPGAPFSGALGAGGPFTIPGYMISQADSNAIKSQIGGPGIGTLDPNNVIPFVGTMVSTSSRGPHNENTTLIKPEIGAPGASVSAVAGTGTGTGAFGGTSGASPMVAGSAALLRQAYPDRSPLEIKAVLMNTGETDIDTDPFSGSTPITRIGGGEVRAGLAFGSPAAAWEDGGTQGALSFGFVDVYKDIITLHKMVRVRNYSESDITYDITPSFRYASDEASGAVHVDAPGKVKVKAGKDATFPVKMTIHGDMLPGNFMNSGNQGANPDALTNNEFDGYLELDDGSQPIHLAWHVLPRRAANVTGRQVLDFDGGVDDIDLTNNGVGTAQNDAYSLLATSPDIPEGSAGQQAPTPDLRAVGINTFPVPAGVCSGQASFVWAFAINTWERQEHLVPVKHFVNLDTDQDGTDDYIVFNNDQSIFSTGSFGTISDGRQLTLAFNLAANTINAFFYAEHSTNTGNTVLLVCGEQIGLSGPDLLATNVDVSVDAFDFYYGGPGDSIGGLTVTPLGEQYFGIPSDIAAKSSGVLTVVDFGPFPGNSPEEGLMLFTNGDRGTGARGGATQATEATLFFPRP